MSLLERPLPAWAKQLARLPLLLYRLRLGRLLGHRFLVVIHRGRRSGRLHHTVVEVVRWDASRREAMVAAGWGARANWWRNLAHADFEHARNVLELGHGTGAFAQPCSSITCRPAAATSASTSAHTCTNSQAVVSPASPTAQSCT